MAVPSNVPDNVDPDTGEILPPYQTRSHLDIKKIVSGQMKYVTENLRDQTDLDKFARLSGDELSMCLMELTGMYESLSKWLADEKLHLADLKTALELKFSHHYVELKKQGSTNETARMEARIHCSDDQKELDLYKHGYDVIESWKKSIGRYADAVRSQLSYEKQMSIMRMGQ
jgi:hypothetical protein